MTFDCILANSPFGKIGVEITNKLIDEIPYNDISILGTRAMLSKHNENLALEYIYIENYILKPETKCKWVRQIILLGHKGTCNVIAPTYYGSNKEIKPNEIRIPFSIQSTGQFRIGFDALTTRNRETSHIMSVPDEEFEYLKEHWKSMEYIERFWWLHDRGLWKRYLNAAPHY